jgi:hypothetical protein
MPEDIKSTNSLMDTTAMLGSITTQSKKVQEKTTAAKDKAPTPEQLLEIQQASSDLANLISMITNIMKIMTEMLKSILGNLR